jgi:4-amino-4-deoxy-L-arabinose transferase-like glycosyltransferase
LHKPILPFWQIALSFALLGVNTFALRLPAAILSTAAAWLTYKIGVELFERRTALIAAGLQAINPFVVALVHGYQFSDTIDVALLFWVEAGIYFLIRAVRTGLWRYVLMAGAAQGCAFLCKSYLAAIIFGLALTAWLLPLCRLARRDECRMSGGRLLALLGMTVLIAAPWVLHCAIRFPVEFAHEHEQVLRHLHSNVENWGAPWDRLLFDRLPDRHPGPLLHPGPRGRARAVARGRRAAAYRLMAQLRVDRGRDCAAPLRRDQDALGNLARAPPLPVAAGPP